MSTTAGKPGRRAADAHLDLELQRREVEMGIFFLGSRVTLLVLLSL